MQISARFTVWLYKRIKPRRAPDRVIGGHHNPYMLRWFIIPRNRWLNIYLHMILRSDDDRALHDHPWPSVSLLLSGPLGELYAGKTGHVERVLETGALVYRGAKFSHRLIIIDWQPAITLFITGPKVREWGFHCPRGWRHWRDFTSGPNGETVGKGCE